MTNRDLEEIQERYDNSTTGEWKAELIDRSVWDGEMHVCDICGWGHLTGQGGLRLSEQEALTIQEDNALFIAHAHQDIPALLKYIKQLEDAHLEIVNTEPDTTNEDGVIYRDISRKAVGFK